MGMKFLFLSCFMTTLVHLSPAQVEVLKFDQLDQLMDANSTELKVFNFWATWCGPCIKELPHFQDANELPNVTVYLVSLDFIEELERVEKFVEKKKLTPRVFLLSETDYDAYMPKVSEKWSGAIPATLMISSSGKEYFYESAFTKSELMNEINKLVIK